MQTVFDNKCHTGVYGINKLNQSRYIFIKLFGMKSLKLMWSDVPYKEPQGQCAAQKFKQTFCSKQCFHILLLKMRFSFARGRATDIPQRLSCCADIFYGMSWHFHCTVTSKPNEYLITVLWYPSIHLSLHLIT